MDRITLYKLDSTGKVREWTGWVEDKTLHFKHGILNGNLIFENYPYSSKAEAEEHLRRRSDKQQDRRGYTRHIPDQVPFRPMLAKRFQEFGQDLPEQIIHQPKLDGYRCLGSYKDMRTRTNTKLPAFPHIQKALSKLPPEIVLDGELYIHGEHFQKIMKSRTNAFTLDSLEMEYHVFDLVDTQAPFVERNVIAIEEVSALLKHWQTDPLVLGRNALPFPIRIVPSSLGSRASAKEYREVYEKKGYEGVMLRDPHSKYELNYRSPGLIKYKTLDRDIYKIVDVIPGPKKPQLGLFVCELSNGVRFEVTPKMTEQEKRNLLKYPQAYIGFALEVEYTGFTQDNKPKNAVGVKVIKW
jgi:ATP-dependent DNA ligase